MLNYFTYDEDKITNEIIALSLKAEDEFTLAISGGRSVTGILTQLKNADVDFHSWHFVIVDERDIKKNSSESNFNQLISFLGHEIKITHFYQEEEINLEHSLEKYEQIKKIDLALLGVGEDGHIASLFPGKEYGNSIIIEVLDSPKPPMRRLSVNYSFFSRCEKAYLIANGEEKFETVMTKKSDLPLFRLSQFTVVELYSDQYKG